MRSPETQAHRELKRLSAQWAQEAGFPICAAEVSLPKCHYRADLVATTLCSWNPDARTAVFECKQSRADCLRDAAPEVLTREAAQRTAQRLHALRELVAVHRPDLRLGESLFPQFDAYDYRGLRHETLTELETELRRLQQKLGCALKFSRLFRYAVADYYYLVTEPDLLEEHELPVGWGWLVREGERLALRRAPVATACNTALRLQLLERIALKTTHQLNRPLEPRSAPAGSRAGRLGPSTFPTWSSAQ